MYILIANWTVYPIHISTTQVYLHAGMYCYRLPPPKKTQINKWQDFIIWDMNENARCRTAPDKESLGWVMQTSLIGLMKSKAVNMTKGVDCPSKMNPWAWRKPDRGCQGDGVCV